LVVGDGLHDDDPRPEFPQRVRHATDDLGFGSLDINLHRFQALRKRDLPRSDQIVEGTDRDLLHHRTHREQRPLGPIVRVPWIGTKGAMLGSRAERRREDLDLIQQAAAPRAWR